LKIALKVPRQAAWPQTSRRGEVVRNGTGPEGPATEISAESFMSFLRVTVNDEFVGG
jgi:hypothetical protein